MWPVLWCNFVLSVWLSVVANLYEFWGYTRHVEDVQRAAGPYLGRYVMGPLIYAGAQTFLWFRLYRDGGRPARVAAGWAGMAMAMIVLVQLLGASIDLPISVSWTSLFAYFSASHLAYALLGRRLEESFVR
jgi:hypothetical protein